MKPLIVVDCVPLYPDPFASLSHLLQHPISAIQGYFKLSELRPDRLRIVKLPDRLVDNCKVAQVPKSTKLLWQLSELYLHSRMLSLLLALYMMIFDKK